MADKLELLPQLGRLTHRVGSGIGYVRQRRVWRETQSMQEMVAALTANWRWKPLARPGRSGLEILC